MIKLINILQEVVGSIYKDDPNTWTHLTDREETIQQIKQKGQFLGPNEDLNEFSYDINKGISGNKQNQNVPNFYKGELYPGSKPTYLITLTPKEPYPGDEDKDWKNVKYPFLPNSNRANRSNFAKSGKIAVLKPEYRDKKNFKFYKFDGKNYVEFDINNF